MLAFSLVALTIVMVLAALYAWRIADRRTTAAVWATLANTAVEDPARFDPYSVAQLPEPAQRFFRFAIQPGTRLHRVVELRLHGELGLGTRNAPNYMPMSARQILAPPHGFVWEVSAARGAVRLRGSDGFGPEGSWSRFRLYGLVPVARAGGDDDHARSAFARYMAEAVFWCPAALLPSATVSWQAIGKDAARVTVRHAHWMQAIEISVDDTGRPVVIEFQRWSDANADKVFRLQPFGGYLSDFREFQGFVLPTRVEAGNHFDTEDYFPFYKAIVDDVRFGP